MKISGFIAGLAFLYFIAALTAGAATPRTARLTPRDCLNSHSLEDLVSCILNHMPGEQSNGYVVPDSAAVSAWRAVIVQMLRGQADEVALPANLSAIYVLQSFTDQTDGESYWVLAEISDDNHDGDVDHGWGTFIVNDEPAQELAIEIPHPKEDQGTELEGIGVFKGTHARCFLLAGASPTANNMPSSCEPLEKESNAAHDAYTLFHATMEEIFSFYGGAGGNFLVIQFHAMSSLHCTGVDAYMTPGTHFVPHAEDRIARLKVNMTLQNPSWSITVPGDLPDCELNGATNVQGRLCNFVPAAEVCLHSASDYSDRFIHIEQKEMCRDAGKWIEAITTTLNATPTPTSTMTPNPSPTPTQTPYYTQTATPLPPTPLPEDSIQVFLYLPAAIFHPGDQFWVAGYIDNSSGRQLSRVPVVFVLGVLDVYYFWPSWEMFNPSSGTGFDFEYEELTPGTTKVDILPYMNWPDTGDQSMADLVFYGAVMTADFTGTVGDFAAAHWGYGP